MTFEVASRALVRWQDGAWNQRTSLGFGPATFLGVPRMRAEVRVAHPGGRVQRVSPERGTYCQACIHPDGSRVVFGGGEAGPPGSGRRACRRATSVP